MNTKVYLDNLAAAVTENELKDLFSPYGNVTEVNVAVDHASGRMCGFGSVTMATPEGARSAIQALDGRALGPCILSASEAPPGGERGHLRRNPRRRASLLY